jgi:hypothetical protein
MEQIFADDDSDTALNYAFRYACYFHIRLPFMEEKFAQDGSIAYDYAVSVLGSRFEAGEPAIAQDGGTAYFYAVNVLGSRFEAGEPAIALDNSLDSDLIDHYVKRFLKDEYQEQEGLLIGEESPYEWTKVFFRYSPREFMIDMLNNNYPLSMGEVLARRKSGYYRSSP